MTPPLTSGAASCAADAPVLNTHASCSCLTFFAVICASGLKPQPLYAPRIVSQFSGSGSLRRAAVTSL